MLRGVQTVNALRHRSTHALVLAVDIPTGLDCDTGEPTSNTVPRAVIADLTVTLAAMKKGFVTTHARAYTGRIEAESIGLSHAFIARFAD